MTARLSEFLKVEPTGRALFIPHCHSDVDPDYDWPSICAQAGLLYLSPRGDSREVIRMIAGARLIISESMHGAIVADAFRVPWRAVSLVSNFNEFKWRDWTDSLSMDIEIVPLSRPLRQARRLVQSVRRRLSSTRDRERFTTSRAGYDRPGSNCSSSRPRNVAVSALQSVQGKLVVRTLRRLAASEPYLSKPTILARRMDALQEKLDGIIKDYGGSR
jgi:succinoglycan biosynthesis protein ExoV